MDIHTDRRLDEGIADPEKKEKEFDMNSYDYSVIP